MWEVLEEAIGWWMQFGANRGIQITSEDIGSVKPVGSWNLEGSSTLGSVDPAFCTPYDTGPCSPMMLELKCPRPVLSPIRYQINLRSIKMENITF